MIIEEIISKREWNSYIFEDGVFDVGYAGCISMEQMLVESTLIIYEDNKDVIDYRDFINSEKSYSIDYNDMITGELYFPINYRGAPFQQTIILDIPRSNSRFIKSDDRSLYFICNRKKIDFTKSNPNSKGTLETLIFKDKTEADNHVLTLKLKFVGWDIKIRRL